MKFKKLSLFLGLVTSFSMCAPFAATPVSADNETPIYEDGFEAETISGWSILGGVGTMLLDATNSHSGSACLSTSDRAQPFNGPSITISKFIDTEETYRFTGWIYQNSSQTESINCTLRFSDSVNVDSYVGVATIEAAPGEWTYFEGTVDTPEDISSTLLYFECQNTDLDFSIDDIQIFGNAPAAAAEEADKEAVQTETVDKYVFDFEGGFDEWISRGDTRLIRTDEQQNSGNYSMLSTNRNKIWNGPAVPVDGIQRETEYTYEASVLYTDKKADESHEFLLQLQYSYNGSETYAFISSAEAQKNVWTKISGVYTVPEGATNVMLYLQTANLPEDADPESVTPTDLVSFYVDDISAIRSDLVGKTDFSQIMNNMSTTTLLFIIGAVVLLAVLIIVIFRLRSNSSEEPSTESSAESTEGIDEVISVLDGGAEKAESTEKTEENEKSEEKAEEKSDKTTSETKSETAPKKKKNKNKNRNNADETLRKKISDVETFSYDDPDAATASDNESSESPDSPFDGF